MFYDKPKMTWAIANRESENPVDRFNAEHIISQTFINASSYVLHHVLEAKVGLWDEEEEMYHMIEEALKALPKIEKKKNHYSYTLTVMKNAYLDHHRMKKALRRPPEVTYDTESLETVGKEDQSNEHRPEMESIIRQKLSHYPWCEAVADVWEKISTHQIPVKSPQTFRWELRNRGLGLDTIDLEILPRLKFLIRSEARTNGL